LLAVFGEMEADAIRARVRATRTHLLRSGRVVGGTVTYGWRSVPNPDGPGYVLAHHPDRIEYVRGMCDRVSHGHSIYSVVQWLDEVVAPLPSASQRRRKRPSWSYSTAERLIRNPILAGMTPLNPGNTTKVRGTEVLRDADGLPVVDESVAIMSASEWRALVRGLDERDSAQSVPTALKAKTSALLSGLIWCGEHLDDEGNGTRTHRGTTQGRHGYSCPVCHQVITNFEDYVVGEFLRMKGERIRWSVGGSTQGRGRDASGDRASAHRVRHRVASHRRRCRGRPPDRANSQPAARPTRGTGQDSTGRAARATSCGLVRRGVGGGRHGGARGGAGCGSWWSRCR